MEFWGKRDTYLAKERGINLPTRECLRLVSNKDVSSPEYMKGYFRRKTGREVES